MFDFYWINYEIQSTISLLGGPQCHIRQFSGKSHHSKFSTCTFLCYTTNANCRS